jgi:DNA invertase Pin-like site-specific DNA recombinase
MDMQEDAILKEGVLPGDIYREVGSGVNSERKELMRLKSNLRKGDTLIVWKLDRIARSVLDFVKMMDEFNKKKIDFVSVMEPNFNTTTAQGKFVYTIFSAVSELEREIIRERTIAGLMAANERGRFGGRPRGISSEAKKTAERAAKLYSDNKFTVVDIMEMLKIKSKPTFYKYLRMEGVTINKLKNKL